MGLQLSREARFNLHYPVLSVRNEIYYYIISYPIGFVFDRDCVRSGMCAIGTHSITEGLHPKVLEDVISFSPIGEKRTSFRDRQSKYKIGPPIWGSLRRS